MQASELVLGSQLVPEPEPVQAAELVLGSQLVPEPEPAQAAELVLGSQLVPEPDSEPASEPVLEPQRAPELAMVSEPELDSPLALSPELGPAVRVQQPAWSRTDAGPVCPPLTHFQ